MSALKRNKKPTKYLNRELSWLQFNSRVLQEAANPENPILERLKFLAIFESNLDEFYMVRVSGLIEQYESGLRELSPDGLSPSQQLALIAEQSSKLREEASQLWSKTLSPLLEKEGIKIHEYTALSLAQATQMSEYFEREVFPLCTPLLLDPAPSLPFISNRSLNLAVQLGAKGDDSKLARLKVPDVLPRLVPLDPRKTEFVLLEEVIRHNLEHLFPGVTIQGAYRFRVIRDADFEIRELEAGDLIESIEQTIHMRRFGDPVLLESEANMPDEVRATLMRLHKLEESDTFVVSGLVGFGVLWEIAALNMPKLKFKPHRPFLSEHFSADLFKTISAQDVLVHHPYDSFQSVEDFVASATNDPRVIGIKQTLYRVGAESPIVEALLEAAFAGKQVAVTVELKARFDESNNLVWARALERAGAHVTFGVPEMKTHCKLCLIVRREGSSIKTYAHVGTGNYNPDTARLYTDLGIFTSNQGLTQDILDLFNYLTGFSKQATFGKLLVAPVNLRSEVIKRINREVEVHKKKGGGYLSFKLNALVDSEVIDALYNAAASGVQVDLLVRGICCLRPGPNIRVGSLVGRFLEHSRILYFHNGGRAQAFIGSADLMPRNLDRRVEVMTPVLNANLVAHLRHNILDVYWNDNTNFWDMQADGSYVRRKPKSNQKPFNAQENLSRKPSASSYLSVR